MCYENTYHRRMQSTSWHNEFDFGFMSTLASLIKKDSIIKSIFSLFVKYCSYYINLSKNEYSLSHKNNFNSRNVDFDIQIADLTIDYGLCSIQYACKNIKYLQVTRSGSRCNFWEHTNLKIDLNIINVIII